MLLCGMAFPFLSSRRTFILSALQMDFESKTNIFRMASPPVKYIAPLVIILDRNLNSGNHPGFELPRIYNPHSSNHVQT